MRCVGCGFSIPAENAPRDRGCNSCGVTLCFDSDDFLLRQYGAPGRDIRTGQVSMGRLVERVIREHAIAFIEAPVGCHSAGQEILMFDGTLKKVEDVAVGDLLYGDEGTPRKVLKLVRGKNGEMVTILPVKGAPWTATVDHVLTVVDSVSSVVRDVTVRDWLAWPKYRRAESNLFRVPAYFKASTTPLPKIKDPLRTGFTVSEYSEVKPYFGFTLDGNGRYLLGDFTVTHNSGKSDAYGVPALNIVDPAAQYTTKGVTRLPTRMAGLKKIKPKVIISTAKKNLQHQIAGKDLPFLLTRRGVEASPAKVALLKGKSNYACRFKAETLKPDDRRSFDAWLTKFPAGDLSDFPGKRPSYLYDATAEDCIGRSCEFARVDEATGAATCGYWTAKVHAAKADVIVTNHHVVAYDLCYGPGVILGPYTTLIIDEAHQAPAAFRGAFSTAITQGGSSKILRQLDAVGWGHGNDNDVRNSWKGMFSHLTASEGEIPKDPFGADGVLTSEVVTRLAKAAMAEATTLGWSTAPTFDIADIKSLPDRQQLIHLLALNKSLVRAGEALQISREPGDNTVLHVTTSINGHKTLTLAPISVGKLAGPKIQQIPSVVLTSATMAINGNFSDIKYQLGLNWASYNDEGGAPNEPKVIHELVLSTPFNYAKQALLYTPRHIPLPASTQDAGRVMYIGALVNECSRLIRASNGNAFVLFTSRQDLQDVYEGLVEEDLPNELILQDDDAAVTLKQYMTTPHSVLLGVKSFWEGVDVQGQKLQLVIIVKLPFPAVTDPVLQARSRQLIMEQVAQGVQLSTAQSAVFNRLQIPSMLTELRQGAGRLIRSKTDRGVLAILDTRVFTGNSKDLPSPTQTTYRGYGKLAVDATEFHNRILDFEVIQRVFAQWNAR